MKKLWTLIAGMALVMSACSEDTTELVGPVGGDDFATLTEITATLPATRTYLEDVDLNELLSSGGGSIKTLWSKGDCISVWSAEDPSRVLLYELKGEGGSETGSFAIKNGKEGIHGKTFYALYNGNSTTPSKQVTINSVQNNNVDRPQNNIAVGASPMVATLVVDSELLSDAQFKFKNLCGIMAVTLTPDMDATLSSITLTSSTALSGTGEIEIRNGEPMFRFSSNQGTQINRNLGSYRVQTDVASTFYFVVPASNYGVLKIDVMSSTSLDPVLTRQRTITGDGLAISAGNITRIANFKLKMTAPHVYAVGDVYPNGATGANVKGIVYQAEANGLSGKMMYPAVLAKTVWTNLTSYENIPISATDGEANMKAVEANIANYPAFQACHNLAAVDGHSWYLPAQNELSVLSQQAQVINKTYKDSSIGSNDLINLQGTDKTLRYWSSTGNATKGTAANTYYVSTEDEETGDTVEEWKMVFTGLNKNMQYNVLAIASFESK